MKAIRLTAAGAPLEVQDVPVPKPGPGEVLIRVAGCGVCHTDIGFWKDGVPTRRALPLTLGHEVSGTVVAAGPGAGDGAGTGDGGDLVGREVIVPAVIPLLREGGFIVALVKPQFEVGRYQVGKGGIVKDGERIDAVLEDIKGFGGSLGLSFRGMAEAPRERERKNREYFILWER